MGKTVNLKGIKTSFEPVPADRYLATLTGSEYREAGVHPKRLKEEDDSINLEFTIAETLDGDDENSGRKVWKNQNLGDTSLWAYKKYMLAAGADADDLEGAIDPEEYTKPFHGEKVVLDISQKTGDNGKPYNNVEDILSPTEFS